MENKSLTVRIDLYGEHDPIDFWEGLILNKTKDEFEALVSGYEHNGSNDIRGTWADYLEKNKVEYKPLVFDIDQKLDW